MEANAINSGGIIPWAPPKGSLYKQTQRKNSIFGTDLINILDMLQAFPLSPSFLNYLAMNANSTYFSFWIKTLIHVILYLSTCIAFLLNYMVSLSLYYKLKCKLLKHCRMYLASILHGLSSSRMMVSFLKRRPSSI